jgi:hypothetical protein
VTFRTRRRRESARASSFVRLPSRGKANERAALLRQWAHSASGQWKQLTRARFTASGASWEAKDTIDAGLVDNTFYLQTGGDTKTSTPLNSFIERKPGAAAPPQVPGGLRSEAHAIDVMTRGPHCVLDPPYPRQHFLDHAPMHVGESAFDAV